MRMRTGLKGLEGMTACPPKREPMTAEEYVQAHGATFVEGLQDNTVECACAHKYGLAHWSSRRACARAMRAHAVSAWSRVHAAWRFDPDQLSMRCSR